MQAHTFALQATHATRETPRPPAAPAELSEEPLTARADAPLVGTMRLALAVAMLATLFVDRSDFTSPGRLALAVFGGYVAYSLVLCLVAHYRRASAGSALVPWADALWLSAIVACSGGVRSIFYLAFLFPILTISFRRGLEDGARMAIASAALASLIAVTPASTSFPARDIPRLLLQTVFLLSLGYMSARWGESTVCLQRKLALLRQVSLLSNPRFGVERTLASVMRRIRDHFGADACVLVTEDADTEECSLRVSAAAEEKGAQAPCLPRREMAGAAAQPVLGALGDALIVHNLRRRGWRRIALTCRTRSDGQRGWLRGLWAPADAVAALLDAPHFISVPLLLRRGHGRLFLTASRRPFGKDDVLFLRHVVAQALPPIENIALLDELATGAAQRERRKIALDLHDTTIQPYIGLRLGLTAARIKAGSDSALAADLDGLIDMANQVIADLRGFTRSFTQHEESDTASLLLPALQRTASHFNRLYALQVSAEADPALRLNDRLTAEVLQVMTEGLHNIRKHTPARRGSVRVSQRDDALRIQIENESGGAPWVMFSPRSICWRVAALGGTVQVKRGGMDGTCVEIAIPL